MTLKHLRTLSAAVLLAALLSVSLAPVQPAQAGSLAAGGCAAVRGSFTGTLTGYASGPTGTIQYRVTENCTVTLWTTSAITGTSNAATLTMTGLPFALYTASTIGPQLLPAIVEDNTADVAGCVSVPSNGGTITFSNSGACAGAMTSTGTKGLPAGWIITYQLY